MTNKLAPTTKFKMPGWPDYWTKERLQDQLDRLRSRAFDSGFRQKPQTSGSLMFPSFKQGSIYEYNVDWKAISDPDSELYDPESEYYVDPTWSRYIGCDIAGKKRRGTVIFTLAVSPSGVRHVLDISMGAWTGPETVRQLQAVDYNKLLTARCIFVENNAYQESLIDWIKEMDVPCWTKVRPFRTGSNKMDQEIGLPVIEVQYSRRRWKIGVPHPEHRPSMPDPKNHTNCICGLCMLIHATKVFTPDDLDETPDTIAAQFIAKEASRQGERFSETSVGVVKVTQGNIQEAISSSHAKQQAQQYRLPVSFAGRPYRSSRPTGGDFGRNPKPAR